MGTIQAKAESLIFAI